MTRPKLSEYDEGYEAGKDNKLMQIKRWLVARSGVAFTERKDEYAKWLRTLADELESLK